MVFKLPEHVTVWKDSLEKKSAGATVDVPVCKENVMQLADDYDCVEEMYSDYVSCVERAEGISFCIKALEQTGLKRETSHRLSLLYRDLAIVSFHREMAKEELKEFGNSLDYASRDCHVPGTDEISARVILSSHNAIHNAIVLNEISDNKKPGCAFFHITEKLQ